jgi:hypothetical protein
LWSLFQGKYHIIVSSFLFMPTREDILEIYKAGPEAVISAIQRLEDIMEQQDIQIDQLKEQVRILKVRCTDYLKE